MIPADRGQNKNGADAPCSDTSVRPAAAESALVNALWEKEQLFRILLEHSSDCEVWIDMSRTVRFVSPSFLHITGYSPENLYRNPDYISAIMVDGDRTVFRRMEKSLNGGVPQLDFEVRIRTAAGKERWVSCDCRRVVDDEDVPQGVRLSLRDVTSRHLLTKQLHHQAGHDLLTGLPNRSLFMERLCKHVEQGDSSSCSGFAVAVIDIDRFKQINDVLGHSAGDVILRGVADRQRGLLGGNDAVCRMGSDEFCLLMTGVDSREDAFARVQQLQQLLHGAFDTGKRRLHVTVSIGVAVAAGEAASAEELMRNSGIALQHAKRAGGGGVAVFSDWMLESALQHAHLEMDLLHALEENAFNLVYQPLMDMEDGLPVRVEVLCRWTHPERGPISPAEFIPVLEETGQVLRLGKWVLESACMAAARWQREHPELADFGISVNLSARQLVQPALVEQIADILKQTGLKPESLKLEVTETMLMENPQLANLAMDRLKDLGVYIAIDDFGTGYSSLAYLQSFPVDTLKIDKSFVQGMTREPGKFNIVKAVTALAHSLGLNVVAEGVEEQEQRIMLSGIGCDYAQGFLFSKPLAYEEIVPKLLEMLRKPE
ncbi:putative bifunctional diguanylate cyclase/phosphodiesterase [Oleidesulfovibrio sp.]|uniref:putative bifunctional diguanylate cyclase/phosphodiesterase n=1 Tax=Oleidesulfovibrio sp. TaxID=2909707 RepID=UPI003A8B9A07